MTTKFEVWINTIAPEYFGRFRVYLRGRQVGGDTTTNYISARLKFFSGYTYYTTETLQFDYVDTWQTLDFGEVSIPSGQVLQSEFTSTNVIRIFIQLASTSATPDVYLYDLILMPVDEFILDTYDPDQNTTTSTRLQFGTYEEIDSIENPRGRLRSLIFGTNGRFLGPWVPITASEAMIQANRDQRLWFFTQSYEDVDGSSKKKSKPEVCHSAQLFGIKRYMSMRGDS